VLGERVHCSLAAEGRATEHGENVDHFRTPTPTPSDVSVLEDVCQDAGLLQMLSDEHDLAKPTGRRRLGLGRRVHEDGRIRESIPVCLLLCEESFHFSS